ncbi:HalOD1 output domain-containing protein [Halorussus caseinilyticus]|uniref:HalOD1 output domain-containing protein n=1 Tax=Halorussus caseinilyticus TaxID=3034025 RepID=A0ABD5WIM5_9EURY
MDDGAFCPNDATEKRHVGDSAPSEAVVRTVAEARDCEPTDLPPLNGTIDPDALDDLFDDTMSGVAAKGATPSSTTATVRWRCWVPTTW